MAIYPLRSNNDNENDNAPPSGADVEAWTETTAQALDGLNLAGGPVEPVNDGVSLDIPLDVRTVRVVEDDEPRIKPGYVRRREPLHRDSLKRRESLQKGKEGSRRRQRWENDRLLNVPNVQPPLPSDWEIRPTHPVHSVPYFLAELWDAEFAARSAARKNKAKAKGGVKKPADNVGLVPKDLREKLKRSRGAKGLLQDLEEEVRGFVELWEEKERKSKSGTIREPDSEDEEIVFVGRDGAMNDMPPSPTFDEEELLERRKLVFDSLAVDSGASFGRFLVHAIGHYYGLDTWSVTVGDPARREAYVGIKEPMKSGHRISSRPALPQPLWGMV